MKHTINRRTLVAGLGAAIPAAGVAVVPVLASAGTDPIFGAIEAHRAAYAAHGAAIRAYGEVEIFSKDEPAASAEALKAEADAEAAVSAASDADFEAWGSLFDTDRTITMTGLIALIRYAAEPIDSWGNRADSYDGRDDEPDILTFIAETLGRLTAARA
jgi:hypothetical protein